MTIHFHDPMDWELANKISNFKMFLEKQLQTPLGRRVGALVLTAEQSMAERQLAKSFDRNLPAIWFQNPHANQQAKLPADFRMSGYAILKPRHNQPSLPHFHW